MLNSKERRECVAFDLTRNTIYHVPYEERRDPFPPSKLSSDDPDDLIIMEANDARHRLRYHTQCIVTYSDSTLWVRVFRRECVRMRRHLPRVDIIFYDEKANVLDAWFGFTADEEDGTVYRGHVPISGVAKLMVRDEYYESVYSLSIDGDEGDASR